MKKSGLFLTLIAVLLVPFIGLSQSKNLTLEDAVLRQYSTLRPSSIPGLQWIAGTHDYVYLDKSDDNHTLMKGSLEGNDVRLTDLASINYNSKGFDLKNPIKSFPRISWESPDVFTFSHNSQVVRFNVTKGEGNVIMTIKSKAGGRDISPDKKNAAIPVDDQLYLFSLTGRQQTLGSDAGNGIVYGTAVHRYEFGISKGTFWSPNSKKLAFYRKDETMVTDYPLVNIGEKPAALNDIKYPMAGMSSHHVTLGVYDLAAGTTTYLETGKPAEQYLTNIAWGPQGKYIYIAVVNRDQNEMKFNQYDAESGKLVKTLFEEKHSKYVEPLTAMRFLPESNDRFLWTSERDGFTHLYLYNTNGKLLKQVTSGEWSVTGILGFDAKGKEVIVSGTGANATERHVYRAGLSSGKVTQITTEAGTHAASLSPDGQYLMDRFSSVDVPTKISILDLRGRAVKVLHEAPNPLADYKLRKAEFLKLKTADGQPMYGRMIKPVDFDASKKYPVLVYVYGGPHAQLVRNTWNASAPLWMYEFANRGYLVFTVDNRGSDNRGRDFEQAVFRNLGQAEMDDQLKGIEYLKTLPYVDANRLAVHGWSFGGFMTTSLLLHHPGVFKVGVAGGPVIDWKYYEIMYTERYMDTPETNPDGFAKASLLDKVDKLDADLLMIHGTVDDVVVWQHSLDFVKACVDNGKQLDYFVYPGHPHNVRGKDRLHLMTKILDYVADNL